MMAQMILISSMMLRSKPPEEVRRDLELLGVIRGNTATCIERIGIIRIHSDELRVKGNDEVIQNTIRLMDKDAVYIPYYKTGSVRLQDIDQPVAFTSLTGGRLYADYQLYTHLFFDLAGDTGQYEVWARRINDESVHVVLVIKEAGGVREADVKVNDIAGIRSKLNISEGLALEVAEALAKYSTFRQIACMQEDEATGECLKPVLLRELARTMEVYTVSYRRSGGVVHTIRSLKLVLPRGLMRINDPFYGEFIAIIGDDGKVKYTAVDVRDLLLELQNRGYIVRNIDEYLLLVLAHLPVSNTYITPGITADCRSIIDPLGQLDLNDYGVDGLIKAREWVKSKYGPNADRALANIALAMAKLITPCLRRSNKVFIDYIIWNYGKGGEGKTALVNIITKLLGAGEDALVAIHGSARTQAQVRNLVGYNRLPLILDEQRLNDLEANAGFIIENAVGMGVIGVHASKYGPGIGARFYNLRGIMIFTNAEFREFLNRVKGIASDFAFIRRVRVINWEHYTPWLGDPPDIKPILGAVNRILSMFEFKDAGDLFTLARQLITALSVTYNADLSDYLKAIDNIAKEASEQSLAYIESDDDKLRYSAYQFTRELGIVIKSWHDVVDAVLNNSNASKVELMQGEQDEVQEVSRRVIELLGADPNEPGSYQHHPNFPASIVRALDNGLVRVRLWAGGLNGSVPSVKQFLGASRSHYPGRGFYYLVSLDRFLQAIINQANTQ